jgi:hypothetical protein
VIAAPPFDAGGVHASATLPSPGVAESSVDGPGVVGVVAESSFERGPTPAEFSAATS